MKTLIALAVATSAFVSPLGTMERPLADNDNQPTVSITKPKFPKRPKNSEAELLALALAALTKK